MSGIMPPFEHCLRVIYFSLSDLPKQKRSLVLLDEKEAVAISQFRMFVSGLH